MIYPWQQTLWQQLTTVAKQQRLSQALLLTGQAGLGKEIFAKTYARYMLCEQPQEYACGQCRQCRLFAAATHPDYFELTLQDKSRVIKIDQVRSLIDSLQKTAFSNWQVVVISPADCMNSAAANALLKTLEEPAGKVLLLLVASSPERLPATIRSRCQRLDFKVTDIDQVRSWLEQKMPSADAERLRRAAHGSPLQALALAEQDYLPLRDAVVTHLQAVLLQQQNPLSPLAEWLKQDVLMLMQVLMCISCDMSKLSMGLKIDQLIYQDCAAVYTAMIAPLSCQALSEWYRQLLSAQALLSGGTHINVQLLFETLLLAWSELK